MPFLFWQSTWFGRPLTNEEIAKDLADAEHPRKTQHALSQIADRIVARDAGVKRWYPQVAGLATHKSEEIRLTAAWVMGQDNSVPEFHQALLGLLQDAHPMVRRNAALSLVRFADDSGREEIRAMLRSFPVRAPQAGTLAPRLKAGDAVNVGTLLGRLKVGDAEVEIRSPVPGVVERWVAQESAAVNPGDELLLISPSPEMAWEALRALVLIGTPDDLPDVERYIHPVEGMPDLVRQQAQLAARSIRSRAQQ
jgi:biotin carboxyl carrier protein